MTKIFVPGKLFLAGEYAITQPGNLALIVAVETGLTITIETASDRSIITSNVITTPLVFDIDRLSHDYHDEWRFVRAAIQIMHDYVYLNDLLADFNNVHITISSDLNSATGKLGLGSSAAVTVAVVKAITQHFHLKLDLLTQFKLAALAHLHVQQNGSLGDVAAIAFGGAIAYTSPDLSSLNVNNHQWLNPTFVDKSWPLLSITPLPWPTDWQLVLGATHESADTAKAVANNTLDSHFLKTSQTIVQQVIVNLIQQNYHKFAKGLHDNQDLLTRTLPNSYITPKLSYLLSTLNQTAGKISGAGFGDNGFAVISSPSTINDQWLAAGIDVHMMNIAPQNRG